MPQPDHVTRRVVTRRVVTGHGPDGSHPSSLAQPGFLFAELLDALPEFLPHYLELAAGDDDPGEPLVLMELAEFVTDRLESTAEGARVLGRALDLVEAIAAAGDDADVELVRHAFFDSFTIEDRRRLVPLLGPSSRRLLESLEIGTTELDGGW